jgi:hypothetical protein
MELKIGDCASKMAQGELGTVIGFSHQMSYSSYRLVASAVIYLHLLEVVEVVVAVSDFQDLTSK